MSAVLDGTVYVETRQRDVPTPWGPVDQLQIGRYDGETMTWRAVWAALQEFAPGRWALSTWPPAEQLVDEVNAYHLWLLPPGVAPGNLRIDRAFEKEATTEDRELAPTSREDPIMSAEICLYCGMPEDSEHTELCSFPRERDEIEHQRWQIDGAKIDTAIELEARLAAARKLLAEHGENCGRAAGGAPPRGSGLPMIAPVEAVRRALNHLISSRVKWQDAPASAETHFAEAVRLLRGLLPDWSAWDAETIQEVDDLASILSVIPTAAVQPLAAAGARPWTYCVDGLPATARRYEAAVVVTSPTPHLDRRFLEWFVGRDGSQGWLGELDCIAYAWREMLPTEELPAPRRRDLTEWPSLGSFLDTLAP